MGPRTRELVAIAASVAARCQSFSEHHLKKVRELGDAQYDIKEAILLADKMGQARGQRMVGFLEGNLE